MSAKYVKVALLVVGAGNMSSLTQISEIGMRQWDSDNISKQIEDEDAKAWRQTQEKRMTANSIKVLANTTKLTNDCTFVGDTLIIGWREKVSQMIYWHGLNSAQNNAVDTFNIACGLFIFIGNVSKPIEFEGITSYIFS